MIYFSPVRPINHLREVHCQQQALSKQYASVAVLFHHLNVVGGYLPRAWLPRLAAELTKWVMLEWIRRTWHPIFCWHTCSMCILCNIYRVNFLSEIFKILATSLLYVFVCSWKCNIFCVRVFWYFKLGTVTTRSLLTKLSCQVCHCTARWQMKPWHRAVVMLDMKARSGQRRESRVSYV